MSEELKNVEEVPTVETKNEIDPFQEIIDFDYSGESEINFIEKCKLIDEFQNNKQSLKENEADNIISNIGSEYIENEYQANLNKIKNSFDSYIKKYNKSYVKDFTEEQRTQAYTILKFIQNTFITQINNIKFVINFSKDEIELIESLLSHKFEYDGVEIFNIHELKTLYLDEWFALYKKLPKNENILKVEVDIKNIVMLYHFLSKCKVKGFSKSYDLFISILNKIGDTNRIYNAFNIIKERVNSDFLSWNDYISIDHLTKEELDERTSQDLKE